MNFTKTLRNAKHIELIYPYYTHKGRTGTAVLFDNRKPEIYDCTVDRLLDALAGYCFTDVNQCRNRSRAWIGKEELRKPPLVLDGDLTLMPVKMRDVRGTRSGLGYVVVQKLAGITYLPKEKEPDGTMADSVGNASGDDADRLNHRGAVLLFKSGHGVVTRQRKRSLMHRWMLAKELTHRYKDEIWKRYMRDEAEEC